MKPDNPLSKAAAKRLVAELDAEIARLDESIERSRRKHSAIAQLRAICEPYMRENPRLTVAGALALDRRARPWVYRKQQ